MRLYLQKGDCQACHGWAADGRKMDSQMPDGPNLRETRLDRARLITTIKCGRPGTGMPAFDKFAYSDGRCYGMKQADLKSADARSAGDVSAARNRSRRRLPAGEGRRQRSDGSRQVHRILGLGGRGLSRTQVEQVDACGTSEIKRSETRC